MPRVSCDWHATCIGCPPPWFPWCWQASKLSELSAKDAALLEAKSKDLRAYLMDHVVPTLAAGLKDVKAAKPADYVDHLVCDRVPALPPPCSTAACLSPQGCMGNKTGRCRANDGGWGWSWGEVGLG